MNDQRIGTDDLANGAVTAAKVAPDVVTAAQLAAAIAGEQPLDADLTTLAANNAGSTSWLRALLDAVYLQSANARLFMSAGAFNPAGSGPNFVNTGNPPINTSSARTAGWHFDAANYESMYGATMVPSDWATINLDLWWMNGGAGAGDVVWRVNLVSLTDAETTDQIGNTDTTVTAPAAFVMKKSRLLTGAAVSSDQLLRIEFQRRGGDAPDTLANDAAIIGVLLTKAS